MTEAVLAPASFRDPSGHVFFKNGGVYRTIADQAAADFDQVVKTGLLDELVGCGLLVPWKEARDVSLDGARWGGVARILEVERLDFISYPYEWSFAGLKQAALTHLDIHLRALSKGVTLSDASAYNIQFDGNRPIFIDHLSLRPYREGQFWQGHRQFCYQFLNPLLLRAKVGVPHNAFYRGSPEGLPSANLNRMLPWRARLDPRVFSHVTLLARFEKTAAKLGNAGVAQAVKGRRLPKQAFERMLKSLRDLIEGLNPHDKGRTAWSDYADANSYSTDEARKKHAFVSEFAQKTEPAMLWDIGCNTGDYSYTALKAGAHLVIGFENDPSALERAFHRSRSDHLRFLPLYLDAADPSPAQGWNQQERMGLAQRRSASAIFALAVIHHICIGRNVPLPEALSWLVGLAPQGVIEFVPKRDSMVQELLRLRDDVFPDYNEPVFDATMAKLARMVRSEVITDNGRRLVWYDRS